MKKYTVALSKESESGCFKASNSDHYNLTLNGLTNEDRGKGISPMEMMLTAAGGCAAIDIISMLKSDGHELKVFDVAVEGFRDTNETPGYFREVNLLFTLEGEVSKEKILRCIELSLEKYCTVGKTLEAFALINWSLNLNGADVHEHRAKLKTKSSVKV